MLNESQKYKLGLFVIAAVVALVTSVMIFAGGELFRARVAVHTFFTESVQGLEVGSSVKFRGAPIGKVTGITIHGADEMQARGRQELKILVRMETSPGLEIGRDASPKESALFLRRQIRLGARCRLEHAGITGVKFIQIDYYAKAGDALPEGVPVKKSLFMPSSPSLLAGVTTDVTATLTKIAAIPFDTLAKDVNRLVNDMSGLARSVEVLVSDKRVEGMLASLSKASGHMEKVTALVENQLSGDKIATLVTQLAEAARSLKKLADDVNQNIAKADFPKLSREASTIVSDADRILKEADLPQTIRSLRTALAAAEVAMGAVARLSADLKTTLDKTNRTLRSADQLIRYLEEDPGSVLHGKRKPQVEIRRK